MSVITGVSWSNIEIDNMPSPMYAAPTAPNYGYKITTYNENSRLYVLKNSNYRITVTSAIRSNIIMQHVERNAFDKYQYTDIPLTFTTHNIKFSLLQDKVNMYER